MHCFPTVEEMTQRALDVCHQCGCGVCEVHAGVLSGLLAKPAIREKCLDAIVCKPRPKISGMTTSAKAREFHGHVKELVVAIAMTWSYVTGESDEDKRSAAVEHFRDAWWGLVRCEMNIAVAETQSSSLLAVNACW